MIARFAAKMLDFGMSYGIPFGEFLPPADRLLYEAPSPRIAKRRIMEERRKARGGSRTEVSRRCCGGPLKLREGTGTTESGPTLVEALAALRRVEAAMGVVEAWIAVEGSQSA